MVWSMAPLCLAGWLMVGLTVIICADSALTLNTECFSVEIKRITDIPTDKRDVEDWKKLSEAYIEVLSDQPTNIFEEKLKIRNKCGPEEQVSMLDDLKVTVGRFNIKSTNLHIPESWQNLWSLRDIKFECGKYYLDTMPTYVKKYKRNMWQLNYVLDCFKSYLNKCGHESDYAKVLENIANKYWDSVKYSSLDLYLRKEVWPKSILKSDPLIGIFRVLRDLSELEINYDEASCKNDELRLKLVDLVQRSRSKEYPKLYKLVKDFFVLYLDKCRYEHRFSELITGSKVGIDNGHSPFANYLSRGIWRLHRNSINFSDWIVNALRILDNLYELAQVDEFDCNSETSSRIYNLHKDAKSGKHTKFVKRIKVLFAKYLEVCTDDFKRRAEQLITGSAELSEEQKAAWEFTKKLDEEIGRMFNNNYGDNPEESRKIIERIWHEARRKETSSLVSETGFASYGEFLDRVQQSCHILWEYMGPTMKALTYDCTPVLKDEGLMDFMNFLGHCTFRETNLDLKFRPINLPMGSRQDKIVSMFDKLGAPYYPTAAPARKLRDAECRRF